MQFAFIPPDLQKLHQYFEKQQAIIFESVKEAYILTCMEAVSRAKNTDTYKDRTNNLRSSIGYVLYFQGELISEQFEQSGKGTGGGGEVRFTTKEGKEASFTAKSKDSSGQQGLAKAKRLANEVAQRHKDGFVAVIVAGENYALFVESNGYDVITGSTLNISEELKKNFEAIDKAHGTNFSQR